VRVPRRLALCALMAGAMMALGTGAGQAGATASAGVRPHATGELDCNGFSPIQAAVKRTLVCRDPSINGTRFEDHDHYIGHDEPSVMFISSKPNSASDVTWNEKLPVEPHALPTVKHPGSDVTHTFELTLAPWFSMNLCDPHSDPLLPCKPRSDSNAPAPGYPGGGSAFMELQFYPPGFAPFSSSISCDNTHWCSALTIDSVECDASGNCNDNCIEPVNFGWIQTNGVPTGPPSPQESNLATYTPNRHTLLMNQGDNIQIHMFDAKVRGGRALEIRETDRTTGRSGYMIASASNGFMNTSPKDCSGTRFNFQPEYNTAKHANVSPWGFGFYSINSQYEIGHFEPCTKITGKVSGPGIDTFWNNCKGPYEAGTPPDTSDPDVEPNDSPCFPKGDTHGGTAAPNQVTGCDVFDAAVGDLDFDGTPYRADWPSAVKPNRYPSTFRVRPPTSEGDSYRQIQFVTDLSASEQNCDLFSGAGCTVPPPGPGNFYPFFTFAKVNGQCVWEFGNMRNGNNFGQESQYGSVGPRTIGAFESKIKAAPAC
jgi:hypothetical protein